MTAQGVSYYEQSAQWDGPAGEAWVAQQNLLDRMFQPLEERLVDEVVASGRNRILDAGCGTGSTTLAVARALGEQGSCLGIDVSASMLAAAKSRALAEGSPARFIHADAQTYLFEPESIDLIVSRFGVMFFDDPIAAFANLRRSASQGAELRLIVWRSAEDNEFMTTGERAAAPILPAVPARTDGPGQFAFADQTKVRHLLAESGWHAIKFRSLDTVCRFPAADLMRYITQLGPVGRVLSQEDGPTQARVAQAILPAYERYVSDDEVRFNAGCWLISARAG